MNALCVGYVECQKWNFFKYCHVIYMYVPDCFAGVARAPLSGVPCLRGVSASPVFFSHIENLSATAFFVGSSSD